MIRPDDQIVWEMLYIQRAIRKDPSSILKVIKNAKEHGYLAAEDALIIHDHYGMKAKDIFILAYSHGVYLDLEGLIKKIDAQDSRAVQARQAVPEQR